MKRKFSQKGISLYLSVVILSIILAVVLGLTTILISQIKMIREIGHSVVALYAADTGIEQVLEVVIEYLTGLGPAPDADYPETLLENDASYRVEVVCCDSADSDCTFSGGAETCPLGLVEDSTCQATYFCIRSVGTFEETQRAIEVKVYPTE